MRSARRSAVVLLVLFATLPAFAAGSSRSLRFAAGRFDPLGGVAPRPPAWYQAAERSESPGGRRYLVAITEGALDTHERRQLEAAGGSVIGYVPDGGYRLRLRASDEEAIRGLPFVLWLGRVPDHLKIAPRLMDSARAELDRKLRVILEEGEEPDRVRSILGGLSILAAPSGRNGAWRVEAEVPGPRLAPILSRLAGLPEVEAIEPVLPVRMLNQDAVWVHQSNMGPTSQQTPIFDEGIFGCGQIVSVADSGQDYDLCYFRDVAGPPPIHSCITVPCAAGATDPNQRKDIVYYNWSPTPTGDDDFCPAIVGGSGHGTHTSGSVAADTSPYADCAGYTSPNRNAADGQAPGAKLVLQEMGDGLEYLTTLGGTLANLTSVAYDSGARIHSFSWGGVCHDLLGTCVPGCTLPYDSLARDVDAAMWDRPDSLVVASAGNSGGLCPAPNAVNTPAIAKNLISVGSVGHGTSASIPSYFSSDGPVFDGRLKPTLSAQGEAVVSAGSDASPATNNCDTCSLDGTSMAAPTVAGLAALVREYYTEGFYAAGTRSPAMGFVPSGALLKATLIDGAVALGAGAPEPDFISGYGRALLGASLAFSGGGFQLRVEDNTAGLITGGVALHAYDVAAGTPFRVTLVWSDYPAALNAATARVNELMLEVTDPNGATWFQTIDGGTGLPAQTSNGAMAHDHLNVEERLVFDSPIPGRWIVKVSGVDVPMGPQPYALVVRGAVADCAPPAAPAPPVLSTPTANEVQVDWTAVGGAAAYNVYRSLDGCGGATAVPVALGVTGTSITDTGVSGQVEYSYTVRAASDPAGACQSPPSSCASVIPSGDCFLPPAFAGIQSAVNTGGSDCAVDLQWGSASSPCGGGVRFNVYRDTSPGFTPSPSTRIARCLGGSAYTDSVDLTTGQAYYYQVTAEDATSGHGGPCRGGNEDANGTELSVIPEGPPGLGTFTDDAGDTSAAKFTALSPWTLSPSGGDSGPGVYVGSSAGGICAALESPEIVLGDPGLGPQLSFSTVHDLEYDAFGIFGAEGSLGQVEISTGPDFDDWSRVTVSPPYPAIVEFPLNNCLTTQNLTNYFTGTDLTYDTYTASLVAWAGGSVKLRFLLAGDILYTTGNWWIDDISVTQALVPAACSSVAAGPPPIPDGASVPGAPMTIDLAGMDTVVTWDNTQCNGAAVNVYWGNIGDYSTFTGAACNLPSTGLASLPIPDDVWILVSSTDGGSTDGSWSRTGDGTELNYAGSSTVCPAITQHVTNNSCP